MKLKNFTFIIIVVVLVISSIISATHYFYNRINKQEIIKESIIRTTSDINFAMFDLNQILGVDGCNHVEVNTILMSRKLSANSYIKSLGLYKGDIPIVTKGENITKLPSAIPNFFGEKKLEKATYFKSIVTCYSEAEAEEYTLLAMIDNVVVNDYLDDQFSEYLLVFSVYPMTLFMFIGLLFSRLIFKPLKELKAYTTEEGVIIPQTFTIAELEDLRHSTVEAFDGLKAERKELLNLSRRDTLTGVDNRYYLNEQVELLIGDMDRLKQSFVLLFLDIDDFKAINDSLGHNIGDEVLVKVVNIIKSILHKDDILARIGGDEFIIVINSVNTDEKLERILSKISKEIKELEICGARNNITASIGIVKYPDDGLTLTSLLQHGDMALFKSKELGKNRHVFFNRSMLDETLYLIKINKDMALALVKDEYELYYQPQIDIATNKIVGAEALIRWNKDGQYISPVEFIPIAEKTGFIIELGWWVILAALKEKKSWESKGYDLTMSINIAANQFSDTNFYEEFKFYMDKFNVNPTQITLEITEYVFLNNATELIDTFNKLKALGVSISLDDFGTGYSSLSYIRRFPIDAIKIDKSFVDDYASEEGKIFLETIISMSINLEIDLVAEGVEEQEQLDFLAKRYCSKYQGYLCSKPVPSKDFQTLYVDSLK